MNIVALRECVIEDLQANINDYFEAVRIDSESYEEAELQEIDRIRCFVKKGMIILRERFLTNLSKKENEND